MDAGSGIVYCSFVEEEVYLHKGNKRDGHTEVEVSVGKNRLKGIVPCGTYLSLLCKRFSGTCENRMESVDDLY